MSALVERVATNGFAEIIGWTLVHFTWQALIIGVVACLVLRGTRQRFVRLRYAICCVGLMLLALAPLGTAGFLSATKPWAVVSKGVETPLPNGSRVDRVRSEDSFPIIPEVVDKSRADLNRGSDQATERRGAAVDQARQDVEPWIACLVGFWLCGVTVLLVRLMGGLIRIRRWKRSATESNDEWLAKTFEQLCERMEIRLHVRLLESHHASVPTVIGWLRPIVLVPSSMLLGLTPAELESVLAHELAHIRRSDYLVNLLQSLLETLLFFHPVVWWLSRQTRIEREHCCDDIAIEICGDRKALAWALMKMEDSRVADQRLVAANGGVLANRIRRIVQREAGVSGWPAGAFTILALAATLSIVMVSSVYAIDEPSIASQTLTAFPMPATTPATTPVHNEASVSGETSSANEGDDGQPDFAKRMTQVLRTDSKTGNEKSVFAGVRLIQGDRQVSQEMIYSNVFNYSFISERVAKALGAESLGEIDFLDHAPNKAERFGPKVDLHVHQVTDPVGDKIVRPYLTDNVWIPGHLGFYGMNATKQHVFKIVRLSKVDLGVGPPLRDVNLLVLKDENSDFGVIGRDLTKRLSRESGQSVMFSADGEMWLQPKGLHSATESNVSTEGSELPDIRVVERDGEQTKRAIILAKQQSKARRRYLLRVQDDIARSQGRRPGNWSTSFETLVSASALKWTDRGATTGAESAEVTMSVPENTGLRVAFSGEQIEVQPKRDHIIVSVAGGQIDLIDQGGVIRAQAKPVAATGRLVARVEVVSDENVLTIRATRANRDPSNVSVRLATGTGAIDDEDVPHGGVRYKLELPEKVNDPIRMRLSTHENLDRLREELKMDENKADELEAGELETHDSDARAATTSLSDLRIMELFGQVPGKQDTGPNWGPRAKAGGLRARLSLVTKHPQAGQPLRLKLELKNVGETPQNYDPQFYSAFRVLNVTDVATGKSDESLGMTYQTSGGEVALAPGETVTLWESADATELFMLDEGTYRLKVVAPRIRDETLPESNELTVDVAAGRQTPPKRLMRAFKKLVPEGWSVSVGWQQSVYLTYKPTRYKRDTATIQLWTSAEPLSDSARRPGMVDIGHFEDVGHVYLSASGSAAAVWPDYVMRLSAAAREVLKK